MIERRLTKILLRDLQWSPILGLVGPRQAGKTTLVRHLQTLIEKPSLYLDLELASDFQKLDDAEHYLAGHEEKCVIIDEVQLRPELFPLLRALTDQRREPARFILLGSASPHVVKQVTETLAGRIAYHELAPFSYSEINHLFTMEDHWFRGGFPGSLLANEQFITRKWLDDFIETFVQRDLTRLGFQVPITLIRRMISMVAHLHGSLLNLSALGKSLGVTHPTVNKYLELLEGSFLVWRLPSYFTNLRKRLVKAPKIYLRDSGMLHHLLRIADIEQLKGHPSIGASWEGYVIEQIIREAPEFTEFYFYRTKSGAEVDLLLLSPAGRMACLEIKYSTSPSISKGFFVSLEDLKPHYRFVITPAGEAYSRSDGIKICPLDHFLKEELKSL